MGKPLPTHAKKVVGNRFQSPSAAPSETFRCGGKLGGLVSSMRHNWMADGQAGLTRTKDCGPFRARHFGGAAMAAIFAFTWSVSALTAFFWASLSAGLAASLPNPFNASANCDPWIFIIT